MADIQRRGRFIIQELNEEETQTYKLDQTEHISRTISENKDFSSFVLNHNNSTWTDGSLLSDFISKKLKKEDLEFILSFKLFPRSDSEPLEASDPQYHQYTDGRKSYNSFNFRKFHDRIRAASEYDPKNYSHIKEDSREENTVDYENKITDRNRNKLVNRGNLDLSSGVNRLSTLEVPVEQENRVFMSPKQLYSNAHRFKTLELKNTETSTSCKLITIGEQENLNKFKSEYNRNFVDCEYFNCSPERSRVLKSEEEENNKIEDRRKESIIVKEEEKRSSQNLNEKLIVSPRHRAQDQQACNFKSNCRILNSKSLISTMDNLSKRNQVDLELHEAYRKISVSSDRITSNSIVSSRLTPTQNKSCRVSSCSRYMDRASWENTLLNSRKSMKILKRGIWKVASDHSGDYLLRQKSRDYFLKRGKVLECESNARAKKRIKIESFNFEIKGLKGDKESACLSTSFSEMNAKAVFCPRCGFECQ